MDFSRLPFDLVADEGAQAFASNALCTTADFRVLKGEETRVPPLPYEDNSVIPGRSWQQCKYAFRSAPSLRETPPILVALFVFSVQQLS